VRLGLSQSALDRTGSVGGVEAGNCGDPPPGVGGGDFTGDALSAD
jgi:hypothetical protein